MTMRQWLATVNLTCRRAARLLSDATERPLSRVERFGLSAHLLGCRSCRRYRSQLRVIATTLGSAARPADDHLSDEARSRIAASVAAAAAAAAAQVSRG